MLPLLLLAAVSRLDGFILEHNRSQTQATAVLRCAVSAKRHIKRLFGIDVPPTRILLCDNTMQFRRLTGRTDNTVGLAYPARRFVVINASADPLSAPLRSLLRHELFHIAVYHFCRRHRTAIPLWLNEGLAQLCEGRRLTPDMERFLRAQAKTYSAASLLKKRYPKDPFKKRLFYAASLSFCRFLTKLGSWRSFFALLAKGYTVDEASVGAFGSDLATLTKRWQQEIARSFSILDLLAAIGLGGFVALFILVAVFVFYVRYHRAKKELIRKETDSWLT